MNWLSLNWQQVTALIASHLQLAVPAIVLSTLIAVPLGRVAYSRPRIGGPILSVATLLYAIPALPLLVLIPVIFGVPLRSSATMVIALTFYGVALMVRSSADAFGAVPSETREAALAVGFSHRAVFWKVDIPLALPVLIAGLRVVAVSTISLVTVGALIGVASLGTLLTDGFQRGIAAEVATGLGGTVALALLIDGVILLIGRMLTPWQRLDAADKTPTSVGT